MAVDAEGNILVCNYGAGEILKFGRDGKALGQFAGDIRGPSAIVAVDGGQTIFVAERQKNRVLRFGQGTRQIEMEDVPEPTGLVWDTKTGSGTSQPRSLWVVSSSTSKVYCREFFDGYNERRVIYATITPNGEERPGFSSLASDGSAFFVSDEAGQRVLLLSASGRIAPFATGISAPAGLAVSPVVGPDQAVYVANAGDGGQLLRLDSAGQKTVVAEKLGRPCGLLFLDAKTLLVSNRDGNIWKITLP